MAPAMLALRLGLAASVALLMCGVALAWTSASFAKRVVGATMALTGAIVGLAVLAAPQAAIVAGVAVLFAYAVIGVGVLARLHEQYGATEIAEIDAADANAEPAEPAA